MTADEYKNLMQARPEFEALMREQQASIAGRCALGWAGFENRGHTPRKAIYESGFDAGVLAALETLMNAGCGDAG